MLAIQSRGQWVPVRYGAVGPDITNDRYWGSGPVVSSAAGMTITPETALRTSAAWACVLLLSETIGMLPLQVFERLDPKGRKIADQHPIYTVLHDHPNDTAMTSMEFRQMLSTHLVLRGNGYAQILPGRRGPVDQLIPLHPDQVTVQRLPNWTMRYLVWDPLNGQTETFLEDEIFHVRGLTLDGRVGVSVLSYARNSLGLSLAAEEYGSRFFSVDARPVGALQTDQLLSDEAQGRLRDNWQAVYGGLSNSHKIAILEQGLKFQQISFSPEDSQLLATRQFSVEDVARWFRVPLHLIGHTQRETTWGSGVELISAGFVTYTLLPWLERWEQTINRRLILNTDRFYAEHELGALLRGDMKTRYDSYAVGRQWGWLSVNDVLELENRNPLPDGGDTYLQPSNMVPAGTQPPVPNAPSGAPEGPSDPSGNAQSPQRQVQLALLARATAERVMRKELAALGKLEKRFAGDSAGWRAAVESFYAAHAPWVSSVLGVGEGLATHYADQQCADVLRHGLQVLDHDGQAAMLDDLTSLALATEVYGRPRAASEVQGG